MSDDKVAAGCHFQKPPKGPTVPLNLFMEVTCLSQERPFSLAGIDFERRILHNRPFFQNKKIGELADCNRHINCHHRSPDTDFFMGGIYGGHHSFLYKAQNNCTNKQL